MAEYTYKDVIIDPTSEEAKNCIGKEVYFADSPTNCLRYANNDDKYHCKILQRIELSDCCPFIVDTGCVNWGSIIPKKKNPEPEYVPFDTIEEFVKSSIEHNKDHYLAGTGIWIKETYNNAGDEYCFVMVNGCSEYDEQISISDNMWMTFKEVFDAYTFLDDTPCGKLKEADNG